MGGTLTDDEMDSAEFEITGVIEKATKFSERKQNHYSNSPFLHSAGVPQQTHTYSNTEVAVQMVLIPLTLIHPY